MISSSKRLLYFPPYIFLFIFFFLYFSLTFAPSLPLHASICQQTIPRRFRPVLSLLFVVSFSNSISEFSWDSVDFFCFFSCLCLRDWYIFGSLSSYVGRGLGFPAAHPRLFDHVMKMDWQERVIAAVWCCCLASTCVKGAPEKMGD